MPKLKDSKRRSHLAGLSSEGHAASGVGLSSRLSEDFAIPTDWTTEERWVGSEVRIRYRSPSGLYFASRTAVQEFLTCPSDASTNIVALLYAVFSRVTSPCGAISKLEERKPFTCANNYAVLQCRAGAYPFSTNFAFRSARASSNVRVKLATAIPFASNYNLDRQFISCTWNFTRIYFDLQWSITVLAVVPCGSLNIRIWWLF